MIHVKCVSNGLTRVALAGVVGVSMCSLAPAGFAQTTAPQPAAAAAPTNAAAPVDASKPAPLVIYFDFGSASIRQGDLAVLDKASRLYSDAKPLVMIVTGATDGVGSAQANLLLSQRRAEAVLNELVARGIPADRFQVLAKGETEPSFPDAKGVPEPRDRRVEIAWR